VRLANILVEKPPEGFRYFADFLSSEEENDLLTVIKGLPWQEVKMHGVIAKRRVLHFGLDYSYERRAVKPTVAPPMFLYPCMHNAARLLNLSFRDLAEVLITEYPVGAGIGWHCDAPMFNQVFGISLLNSCVIKFRIKRHNYYEVFKMELASRSAYLLSGAARFRWQHHIPGVKSLRYSITFRTLNSSVEIQS
jgi:alkylated DNA repair protein (DNA oxidative demethylase)